MVPEHLEFGLLGEHLGHSFSPAIHRQLGDYDYQLVELPPDQVGPFLQEGSFRGLNVTIPYKKTVMAYCQKLSPAAERIGSVNTIVRRPDGTLYGDNTDYDGFRYLLQSAGAQVQGKKVLVLGSGGASLTVRAVLAEKSRAGHTAEVRALLLKHGADKLSEVNPAEYPALLADVEVL